MDEQTSIQICGLIAGILSSDEELNSHEAGFLRRIRERFEVSKGAPVQPILDHDEAIARLRAFSHDVQQEAFDLLLQAAAADGQIAPAERSFLEVVAETLQLAPGELAERLEQELARVRPQPFAPSNED
jgi:uncharacterized tellurite resistance protein B-like protein